MYRTFLPALFAFALTLALPAFVKAETSATNSDATVIIYRADESSKTDRLGFYMLADGQLLGRIKGERSLVATLPAGSYELRSTLPGAEPISVELKPGAVHYVHKQVRVVGNDVHSDMLEVEESVAHAQGAKRFEDTI